MTSSTRSRRAGPRAADGVAHRQAAAGLAVPKGVLLGCAETAGAPPDRARSGRSAISGSRPRCSATRRSRRASTTRDTERALAGSRHRGARPRDLRPPLWDYWERPPRPRSAPDRTLAGAVSGKHVVITGASSGIGQVAALKVAQAGAIPVLVARGADKLEATRRGDREPRRHRLRLPVRPLRPRGDRRARRSSCSRTTRASTCWSTTPAARSAARLQPPRPFPRLRAHHAAQLLRRDPADHGAAAGHARGAAAATSSTSPRSACRPIRRASRPTSRRRRRSTPGPPACPPRSWTTASRSPRSTCRWCARR